MTKLEAAALRLAVARRDSNNANEAFKQCLRSGHRFLTSEVSEAKTKADVELALAVDAVVLALSEQLAEKDDTTLPYTLAGVSQ